MNTTLSVGRTSMPFAVDRRSAAPALIGRVFMAAIFLLSGAAKVADPTSTLGYIGSAGLPFPKVALGIAILMELVGGLLLLVGYRTKFIAAALAVFTLTAAFGFHFQLADQNQFIHFFKNVAIAGGLLQVFAFGGGRFGVERR
jgi:putative oxidoreductase